MDDLRAILERLVLAAERQADALERLATVPSGALPATGRAQRRVARVQPPAEPVDEVAAARAKGALRRRGLR